MTLIRQIEADASAIKALRRDIHAHPELGFAEDRTADLIEAKLRAWDIPVHRLGRTGLIGIIKNGTSKRAVGLRADIDAVPMTELNTFAHKSTNPGMMHCCGHDGHTAMLLSAAQYLARHRNFDGTVYLIFQPAEEGLAYCDGRSGADQMVKDGLFEKYPMDAVFGIHNVHHVEAGQFAIATGPVYASYNEFKIAIHGASAHSGMPHEGIDPVPAAAQIVHAFQTIVSRNKDPMDTSVISFTYLKAGESVPGESIYVTPASCEMQGVVQTFSVAATDMIERRMREIAEGTAKAFGTKCEFAFIRHCPPTANHPREAKIVREVLVDLVGADNVKDWQATMKGAEDFSYFLLERPGCYFYIGNGSGGHRDTGHGGGPCEVHNPGFDFNDDIIPLGGSMWVKLVERMLAKTS